VEGEAQLVMLVGVATAVPPVGVPVHDPIQLILAVKPAATTLPSDVNRIVREPEVDVMTGGIVVPLPLNNIVPPVPAPSNTVTKSQQVSRAN
jgi:hypothetical protein